MGKNVLVRSLSAIGQAGAIFVGQGSLSQPLSESDLMRERVSNNIGETGRPGKRGKGVPAQTGLP
jgi:hypothetical protein